MFQRSCLKETLTQISVSQRTARPWSCCPLDVLKARHRTQLVQHNSIPARTKISNFSKLGKEPEFMQKNERNIKINMNEI